MRWSSLPRRCSESSRGLRPEKWVNKGQTKLSMFQKPTSTDKLLIRQQEKDTSRRLNWCCMDCIGKYKKNDLCCILLDYSSRIVILRHVVKTRLSMGLTWPQFLSVSPSKPYFIHHRDHKQLRKACQSCMRITPFEAMPLTKNSAHLLWSAPGRKICYLYANIADAPD